MKLTGGATVTEIGDAFNVDVTAVQRNYYPQHSHHYATTSYEAMGVACVAHLGVMSMGDWLFSMITVALARTCAVKRVLAVGVEASLNGESDLNERIFVIN